LQTEAHLNKSELGDLLVSGCNIQIGPFCFNIKTSIPSVIQNFSHLYTDHAILDKQAFVDFYVSINPPANLRRWIRPQAVFEIDDYRPLEPLPLAHAYPLFEWGLNWCIANKAHQYLIFHAAILEKDGKAILLPGEPGSGKSTLCTILAHTGWSLMSDELTLLTVPTAEVIPIPKPISLKNQSISVIKNLFPKSDFGNVYENTSKGTLTHLKAPLPSTQVAKIKWIIFPKFGEHAETDLQEITKGAAHMRLLQNAFNHNVFGKTGFETINRVLDQSEVFSFSYSDSDTALNAVKEITGTN